MVIDGTGSSFRRVPWTKLAPVARTEGVGVSMPPSATSGTNNVFNLIGSGTAANPQFVIQTLARTLYNNAGQVVESDSYQSINNGIYLATAAGTPYSGSLISNPTSPSQTGNYYASYMAYDVNGLVYKTVDANGTIQDTVYDSLGRVVSDWTGTNDNISNAGGTSSYFDGSNVATGQNGFYHKNL